MVRHLKAGDKPHHRTFGNPHYQTLFHWMPQLTTIVWDRCGLQQHTAVHRQQASISMRDLPCHCKRTVQNRLLLSMNTRKHHTRSGGGITAAAMSSCNVRTTMESKTGL